MTSDTSDFSSIKDEALRRDVEQLCSANAGVRGVLERVVGYFAGAGGAGSTSATGATSPTRAATTPPGLAQLGAYVASVSPLGFAQPARKTLSLAVHAKALVLATPATGGVACAVGLARVAAVLCVPTPNKPRENYSLLVSVSSADALCFADPAILGAAQAAARPDALLCAFDNSGAVLDIKSPHDDLAATLQKQDPKKDRLLNVIRRVFPNIQEPDMKVFDQAAPGKLGRGGVCWINGLVKMKDGHLYLLPKTLFFGFKKPLLVLPHSQVRSISFAVITSRTFSLLIHYYPTVNDSSASSSSSSSSSSSISSLSKMESFELEMIDKSDLEGVLAYFKGRGIPVASADEPIPSNASLAATAKKKDSSADRVVLMGSGELVHDDDNDDDADQSTRLDSNGNVCNVDGNGDDEDSEDDADFVGNSDDDDDDLDEEYDSDHQTNDGSSDDDDDNDDNDNDEDDEQEEEEEEPLVIDNAMNDDETGSNVAKMSTASSSSSSRKRKSEEDLVVDGNSGKSKRQFLAVNQDEDEEEEDEDDEDDIDELEL
ncbi:hypothetical protein BDR26DRAFT_919909 [Obelidium mucronatum]|nr:hypothetical protein BDR26DRAFT_919909 [Obelidium mucronatum]